jgi:hypothetical protein
VIDARLVAKLGGEGGGRRTYPRPPDVGDALGHASKQFQLWDVPREAMTPDARLEHPERPRFAAVAPRPLERIAPEPTLAMAAFVPASVAAAKAFRGFRALVRVAMTRPFARGDRA